MEAAKPFLIGGTSGIVATCCIQPIDMVKVRIQLAPDSMGAASVAGNIIRQEGFMSLYNGLSAGVLRQAVYTTARLGLFSTFLDRVTAGKPKEATFYQRSAAGLSAGALAALVGNPADLALVRMQSDALKPANQRSNYSSVLAALGDIARKEGIMGWWRGAFPTVLRASALNLGQLAGFSQVNSMLQKSGMNSNVSPYPASFVAGFFAAFLSLPFDYVKTKLQRAGTSQYRGFGHCFASTLREDGVLRFWRGFGTYFVRIAPHASITLLVANELTRLTAKDASKGGL